jgi:predicted nucleic acid-binding protein
MKIDDALQGISRLGLDSAPIIYFVEGNPDFHALCVPFFAAIDRGVLEACTSTITLPETLVHPLRNGDAPRAAAFRNLLLATQGITTVPLSVTIAERTARLRADFNLRTPDAVQIATALLSGCQAFLTNDERLKRVTEIQVLVIGELEI